MDIKIIRADARHRNSINYLITSTKIGSRIRGPVRNFWVAKMGERIIGCAGLEFLDSGAAILTHLAVEKAFRHRGVGSTLIRHRITIAQKRGMRLLALVTMYYLFNFYKRRGFRTCPRAELPEEVQSYWMFTAKHYKKCAVMIQNL